MHTLIIYISNGFQFHFRYEKPIDTPRDMAERNSKWGAMDECFIFFLRESLDPTMLSLVSNFVLGTEEYFTKRTNTRELGFAIEKLQNGKFNLYHNCTIILPDVVVCDGNIYTSLKKATTGCLRKISSLHLFYKVSIEITAIYCRPVL